MTDNSRPKPVTISDASWLRAPSTQQVFAALNKDGHIARAVGGCVRNSLFAQITDEQSDMEPTATDIDIATTATPEEILKLAAGAGLRTIPTGLQHGTVTVIANGEGFEVTTLRRDIATDGRHAEVAFTDDWALDAARRDLTMNALYAAADGTIFDPLGGYDDLCTRRVRFVGDPATRIREDYLRILRFFRFFAQYGNDEPDPTGLQACIAERAGLARLSAERIHHELIKLLIAPGAKKTLNIMFGHGLIADILPIAPNISRFARLIERDCPPDATLRLAVLTVHVEENAARLRDHLRLSKLETDVLHRVAQQLAPGVPRKPDPTSARRLLYRLGPNNYVQLIKLFWTLNRCAANDKDWLCLIQLPENWIPPDFPIDGHDLIDLGAVTSPQMGKLLDQLKTIWLESDFTRSRKALMADARVLLGMN